MALIFDGFSAASQAAAFAADVGGQVYEDQAASNQVDPFPYQLDGQVVLVGRDSPDMEELIIEIVNEYGGTFAGT